jgi:hypothetical protein
MVTSTLSGLRRVRRSASTHVVAHSYKRVCEYAPFQLRPDEGGSRAREAQGPSGWGAGRVGSAPPPPLHARRLGGALRPRPMRRNGRPGPCPSGPREHLSMRGDALPYITIYCAVHGDRRVGSTCLCRRPLSRRVGSTCTSLLAASVPLASLAGIAAPAHPPAPSSASAAFSPPSEGNRGAPPPHRFHIGRPPCGKEVGEKEGLFPVHRLHVGGPALGGAEPAALRGPRAPGHIAGSLRQSSAQRFMHATQHRPNASSSMPLCGALVS